MTFLLKDECRLYCPTSNQIDKFWTVSREHIKRALERGSSYTIDDIYKGLKLKEMQLWCWGDEASLVTTIQNKDENRWLLFLALGGENMDQWQQFLPVVEAWARRKGCTEMRIYGRAGWKRLGFRIEYTKLVREL